MDKNEHIAESSARREWIQPELRRLEAGAAESERGAVPDGGGGAQGS
ncbi:MAG: hypothetical protein ACXWUX_14475 [Allosphingosinicella sp.]